MRTLLLLGLVVLSLAGCSPNNVDIDSSLEKHFKQNGVNGTFALFNNSTGRFTIYNLERYRDSAFSPASTFKIVNSLIGLQTGKIVDEKMIIPWDGVQRQFEAWNKDLTMMDAFRASAVPYYQEVARRIGKDTMQSWLDTLSYGSKQIKTSVDSFWLDNSLTITPDEQLGLIKNLYFYKLPFHKPYMEVVKRAMLMEDRPAYKLSYKTGWNNDSTGKHNGWIVGWIEENGHPYFFVLNLESNQKEFDMPTVRMNMLKDILKEMGFFEGNK